MMNEQEIRLKLFSWLNQKSIRNGSVFPRDQLKSGFNVDGKTITLVGPTGIWTPAGFSMPISISTTTTGPYDDDINEDAVLVYKYRGTDPDHRDNIGLREAMRTRTPLAYFRSIRPGKYIAIWPVFVIEDTPSELAVRVQINPAYTMAGKLDVKGIADPYNQDENPDVRRYLTVLTKHRLHQITFREFVLDAYNQRCTLCNLQHTELLDAAHIIPDSEPGGEPVVPNGLSLCKIHHAAYDNHFIGITPDYSIKVRADILQESDGPMLKYGLQAMEGNQLILPHNLRDYPDRERLERRYKIFLSA